MAAEKSAGRSPMVAGAIGGAIAVAVLAVLGMLLIRRLGPKMMPRMMKRMMRDGECSEEMRACMERCGCGDPAEGAED